MDIARQALQECGYELVEIEIPEIMEICKLIPKLLYSCSLSYVHQMLGDEPLIKNYKKTMIILNLPSWVKLILKHLLSLLGQTR